MKLVFHKHNFHERVLELQSHCPRLGERVAAINRDDDNGEIEGVVVKIEWSMESKREPEVYIQLL